jgi:hypothetical protein
LEGFGVASIVGFKQWLRDDDVRRAVDSIRTIVLGGDVTATRYRTSHHATSKPSSKRVTPRPCVGGKSNQCCLFSELVGKSFQVWTRNGKVGGSMEKWEDQWKSGRTNGKVGGTMKKWERSKEKCEDQQSLIKDRKQGR